MTRFTASSFIALSLACGCGALAACGSFTSETTADSGDAAAPDAAVDGAPPNDSAPVTDAGPGDGAAAVVVEIAKGLTLPWKIAAAPTHLYVTTHTDPGEVLELAYDGSASSGFATGLTLPTEISAGPAYVHWLSNALIWRRSIAGGEPAQSQAVNVPPVALATRPSGAIVYAFPGNGQSAQGGLAGASPTFDNIEYFGDQPDIASIGLVGDTAVIIGLGATGPAQGLRRYDFSPPGNKTMQLSADTFGAVVAIATDAERIVFAEANGAVHELKLAAYATAGATKQVATGGPVTSNGIVVDEARRRVYWLNTDGAIHRYELASGVVSVEAIGCALPGGIAQNNARLYWTCPDKGTVEALAK